MSTPKPSHTPKHENLFHSLEYVVLYYPIIISTMSYLSTLESPLKNLCYSNSPRSSYCKHYLRGTSSIFPKILGLNMITDKGDAQWSAFRGALPILAAFAAFSVVASIALTKKVKVKKSRVNLLIGLAFGCYVHGCGVIWPILFASLFHFVGNFTKGTSVHAFVIWSLAGLTIVAKEPNLPIKQYLNYRTILGRSHGYLDHGVYAGEYSWHLSMNLVLLRLISSSMDGHWAASGEKTEGKARQNKNKNEDKKDKKNKKDNENEYRERVKTSRPKEEYSLENVLSHAFYAPLFLAGPTIPFNAYMSYCKKGHGKTWFEIFEYCARVVVAIAYLDVGTSLVHPFALMRAGILKNDIAPKLSGGAVWFTLCFMWLKFLILWRVARGWCLADG